MAGSVRSFLRTILVFLTLDLAWIYLVAYPEWSVMIQTIQDSVMIPQYAYAIATYVVLIYGLYVFAVQRVDKTNLIRDSVFYGGLYGLATYGTLHGTMLSLMTPWRLRVAALDLVWGTLLCIVTTYLANI